MEELKHEKNDNRGGRIVPSNKDNNTNHKNYH